MVSILGLLLLATPPLGRAADISVHTTRHVDTFEVEAVADIEADVADAWQVLTDYDRLAQFIPGMQESRVVSRNGSSVVVEQRGEARMLFFTLPMQVRLAIEEHPYDWIASRAISGNFKDVQGEYHLEALGAKVRLRYAGRFTPDFGIPPLIGTLLVRKTVARRFAAMVGEIEKARRSESVPVDSRK
jgi:ribosome-associated toxin RatA of RatAB toxin-antitoxin module